MFIEVTLFQEPPLLWKISGWALEQYPDIFVYFKVKVEVANVKVRLNSRFRESDVRNSFTASWVRDTVRILSNI